MSPSPPSDLPSSSTPSTLPPSSSQPPSSLPSSLSPASLSKTGYDARAAAYLSWTQSRPSSRLSQIQSLLSHLPSSVPPSSAKILELGCGAGVPVTQYLASTCAHVTANDISATQITLARDEYLKEFDNVKLVEGDMTGLKFEEGSFDAIAAIYSVIHLDLEGQRSVLKGCEKWLKRGGVLLVNLATEEDGGHVVGNWLGMEEGVYWSSFGEEGNKRLLEKECGFEVVGCEVSEDVEDSRFGWWICRKKG